MRYAPGQQDRSLGKGKPLARKRLGQHFLTNRFFLEAMLEKINPQSNEHFGEIAAGDGALTVPLAGRCASLTAIEIDPNIFSLLQKNTARLDNIKLILGDVLTTDTTTIVPANARLVGNLPYNKSVAIIEQYFQRADIADMHFLVQREIAQRLFAEPGDKNYGKLSLLCNWHAEGCVALEVPPEAFSPPPKVWSNFIYLKTHKKVPASVSKKDPALTQLINAVFHRKHRKLSNNLSAYTDGDRILREMGINDKRALDITSDEILELFKRLTSTNAKK